MADVTFIPNPLVGAQWERSPEARAAVMTYGKRVADRASQLAPRRTGKLASSIAATEATGSGPARAEILADVDYAAYVEFGTSRQAPEPFLRPALDEEVR